MVSQLTGDGTEEQLSCYKARSFVRGVHVHAYKEQSEPRTGQVLAVKREPANSLDKSALSVVKPNSTMVRHIPYNMAPVILSFLARDCNKGSVEIIGKRVNRGAGFGLEAPCTYGPNKHLKHLEDMVSRLRD